MSLKAALHIEITLRNGKTVLKKAFCTQPYKLADVTEDRRSTALKLMIRSSSPGILDGDDYDIRIDMAEGCSLEIETQSYQRLFQMKHGAVQSMAVVMRKNSFFTYLPHPSVPHRGSVFRTKNDVHLSEGCSLIWGEIISGGRKLNGELFAFSLYHTLTKIFKDKKLVVKENLLMKPAETNISGIGFLEGFSHQSTLIYLNEMADSSELTTVLVNELKQHTGISFGVSALPVTGILVRMLGNKGEQLFSLQNKLAACIQDFQRRGGVKKEAYVV